MAVFEGLSTKLQDIVKKLKGKARVTEKDLKEVMRDIRMALLEADVNYKVVKEFTNTVTERALGSDVLESLTPGQQVIKIVNEEMTSLLGGTVSKLTYSPKPPTVYMLVGLQGAGKTTACGKLSNLLRKDGKKPLMVACDIYRPAAIKQLQVVGKQLDILVYAEEDNKNAVNIANNAIKYAQKGGFDTVLVDTAGRLHVNEELMQELQDIKSKVKPMEVLLVVDAMTGQDAVNVAQSFSEEVGIDGVILTKLDGDTRGGAALTVKSVTGKPIKFASVGEKLNDIEPFYPDRMASRILGMGDVLSLIEKAQESFDEQKALELEKKIRAKGFDLNDFLDQMEEMKKMGPLDQLLGMIPGMNAKALQGLSVDEKKLDRIKAIIRSMTMKERSNPNIIDASRKKRIASGSGTGVQDVNRLLKDFEQINKMMKMMNQKGKKGFKGMKNMQFPF
ncbi:MAG TPA: signal recognition particle protein [Clostridiales bacterium]|nr:signal recognition particle protein [Clostridiales bacterium]